MSNSPNPSAPRSARMPTLRIVDLLTTTVQSVRIDLLGKRGAPVTRLGSVLLYFPLLLIGYVLLLVSLVRVVAVAWGWTVTCLVFGLAHVLISAVGMLHRSTAGAAIAHDVVEPTLGSNGGQTKNGRSETVSTVPRPPSVPGIPLQGLAARPGGYPGSNMQARQR